MNQEKHLTGRRNGRQKVVTQREHSLERQREILRYIIDIGASLRLNMDTDTLLRRVSEATCKALHFRFSALYLFDGGYFHARAGSGLNPKQERYLAEHPIPEHVVRMLLCEEYRISDSYLIPGAAPIWRQNDGYVSRFFIVVDDHEEPTPLASDLAAERKPLSSPEWDIEDLLIVPLYGADNSMLGFLTPDSPLNGLRPTVETLELFELFANQAAVVIEGTRLYEELQLHSEERAALVEIGRALSAPEDPGDLQAIYETIAQQAARLIPLDSFYVSRYLQTAQGDEFVMDYLIDEGIRYPNVNYRSTRLQDYDLVFHEPVGRLLSTNEEYLQYVQTDPKYVPSSSYLGSGRCSESFLFVPIRYGEKPLGILSAQSYKPYMFTQRHLNLLKEIGVQAGIAMENARLYIELREALKQAQESERLKNHFLMTASHELRTPLTSIQGYLELLGDFSDTLDDEAKSRFINNARRACEELVLLLGNVMDASRIDQDRVTLKLEPVRVIRAVLMILEILEPILVREERALQIDVSDDLQVWADDLRLRQILLNIVGNALKYTPQQSGVAISAERKRWEELCKLPSFPVSERCPERPASGSFVVIAIRDWGPGVSLEDQARLFTKFMRLNNALNSTQRGAGLGLYLCRQLTEAMGGSIWMESAGIPGEGSTFYIALPLYIDPADGEHHS